MINKSQLKINLMFCIVIAGFSNCASLTTGSAEEQDGCGVNQLNMMMADEQNLCIFYRCSVEGVVTEYCPQRTRIPTRLPTNRFVQLSETPCSVKQKPNQILTCQRCDIMEQDSTPIPELNACDNNPCNSGCTCEDLYQSFRCNCPSENALVNDLNWWNDEPLGFFCEPNPCLNGGTCSSQWDTYWCRCQERFYGKNCEHHYCEPNPCENGGTCLPQLDSYICVCPVGFSGICCNKTLKNDEDSIGPTTQRPYYKQTTTVKTTRRTYFEQTTTVLKTKHPYYN